MIFVNCEFLTANQIKSNQEDEEEENMIMMEIEREKYGIEHNSVKFHIV